MLQDFKEFINKGNIVAIAVALVLALYFQSVLDAFLEGIIYPIIAAIFGKPQIRDIGFTINEARFSIGLIINAAIMFVIVAFVLFLVVQAYNRYVAKPQEEEAGPTQEELLAEIRDLLRNR